MMTPETIIKTKKETNKVKANDTEYQSAKIQGQIDLETKIADLKDTSNLDNLDNLDTEAENDPLTFLETKEKELSEILNKQDDNLPNGTEENQFLKKISNLFSNNKHKNIVNKLEKENEVYPLKDIVENETSDQNKPLINLNDNPIKSENNSEQISLLDIDENEKTENIDDVLEIPAFLRRQAN